MLAARPYQLDDFILHEASAPGARPAYDVIRQACPPSSLARRTPLSPSPGTNPHVSQRHTSRFTTPPSLGSFLAHPDLERATWCDQPDLQELHQTFIRPLSFSWTDVTWPVFSNSKLEGFNDVLVPAWYEWYDRMPYDDAKDVEWKGKANQVRRLSPSPLPLRPDLSPSTLMHAETDSLSLPMRAALLARDQHGRALGRARVDGLDEEPACL